MSDPAGSARPFPHVDGVRHRFVDAGGVRLHVAEAGAGEPLVMLHGWPQHWWVFRHQIPQLARRYHVICPDLRGFGWSDAPPGRYDKETLATDVLALLDALGIDGPVRIAGHDWGGWIGFLLCLRQPARFRRFLALNIAPPWVRLDPLALGAAARLWYQAALATPFLGEWLIRGPRRFLRAALTADSTRVVPRGEAELATYIEPLREPARARATVQLYRTFLLREFPAAMRGRYRTQRLTVPTLLLFGTRDFAISERLVVGSEWNADAMRIELVPDSGHFITEDRPELVTARALEFFAAA